MLTEAVAYMAEFTPTSVFTRTSVNNKLHTGTQQNKQEHIKQLHLL